MSVAKSTNKVQVVRFSINDCRNQPGLKAVGSQHAAMPKHFKQTHKRFSKLPCDAECPYCDYEFRCFRSAVHKCSDPLSPFNRMDHVDIGTRSCDSPPPLEPIPGKTP